MQQTLPFFCCCCRRVAPPAAASPRTPARNFEQGPQQHAAVAAAAREGAAFGTPFYPRHPPLPCRPLLLPAPPPPLHPLFFLAAADGLWFSPFYTPLFDAHTHDTHTHTLSFLCFSPPIMYSDAALAAQPGDLPRNVCVCCAHAHAPMHGAPPHGGAPLVEPNAPAACTLTHADTHTRTYTSIYTHTGPLPAPPPLTHTHTQRPSFSYDKHNQACPLLKCRQHSLSFPIYICRVTLCSPETKKH